MRVLLHLSLTPLLLFGLSGCALLGTLGPASEADEADEADEAGSEQDRFPDVVAVRLRATGDRTYDVVVTVSSPYDSPERYADGWRVLDPEGEVLGSHHLLHHHAAEQPFTRTQTGLHVPAGVARLTVEARDQRYGFGGRTVTVEVPA